MSHRPRDRAPGRLGTAPVGLRARCPRHVWQLLTPQLYCPTCRDTWDHRHLVDADRTQLDAPDAVAGARAVETDLTPAQRRRLYADCGDFRVLGPWWRVTVLHEKYLLLAATRTVQVATAAGQSRTAALVAAAARYGMSYSTLRDALRRLAAERGVPESDGNPSALRFE